MTGAVFYISGHGFGHAVRTTEVIRELTVRQPSSSIVVRTTAPAHLFDHLPANSIRVEPVAIDSGVVEADGTLQIDAAATIDRLEEFLDRRAEIVEAEVNFIQQARPDVIVADIPYLAGEIGGRTGVPVVGISNFTWDYIYEPFLQSHRRGADLLRVIKNGYAQMTMFLRLPFHHETDIFRQVIDVGLVAPVCQRPRDQILRELGVAGDDNRPRVYLGQRGAVSHTALRIAAEESPECLFLYTGTEGVNLPPNTRLLHMGPQLTFPDILAVSEIVVSKLGYGMLAACVANGARLLYPPRTGFREDLGLQTGADRYLCARELPLDAFRSGHWGAHIQALTRQPAPLESLSLDGAKQCADLILSLGRTRNRP